MDEGWIIASKLIPLTVLPFNLALSLSLLGLIFMSLRYRRLGLTSMSTGVMILLISSSPLAVSLYESHERKYEPISVINSQVADAIVVLGGDVGIPLAPRVASQLEGNRIYHAFKLYMANKAPLIVVTGGNVFPQQKAQSESAYAADILVSLGVPKDAIVVEGMSRNTRENAMYTSKLLELYKIDKILLVTSAFHMPRALSVFRTLGIDANPAPASYSIVNYSQPTILDWMPSLGNLGKMQAVIREKLGILVYRYRGWIS